MNRMSKLLLSFLVLSVCSVGAQGLTHIREIYRSVNAQIETCNSNSGESDNNCELYSNVLNINSQGNSWRAVGDYNKLTKFWYNDEPPFSEIESKPEAVLQKIEVTISSTYNIYEEYLFENGALIFYYHRYDYGEEIQEARFYFKDGKLIEFISSVAEEAEPELERSDYARVMEKGEALQVSFLESMK